MQIYLLTSDYYGDNLVVGVFADRDAAERYAQKFIRSGYKVKETALLTTVPEYELTPVIF